MTSSRWTARDLAPQAGRTYLITGANSGIGLAAAREFARAGAYVVLAVRDVDKGERAAASIGGHTEVRRLDLGDLASIRRLAEEWDRDLDVLVNNAGVANTPLRHTTDGFELQIGTNHLGHFALTNLLLPRLRDRVVTIASNAHLSATLDLNDLNWERRTYRTMAAYAQSKLANLLFTLELERRLRRSRPDLRAVAAHPGIAATNLNRDLNPALAAVNAVVSRLVAQPEDLGALSTLYAATRDLPGGSYVGPSGRGGRRGEPALVGRSVGAGDPDLAERLWTLSEQLTHTSFPLPALT